jgi:glycosyltransferase involved in cell wall biosynthesis
MTTTLEDQTGAARASRSISVVIPLFNEEVTLQELYDRLTVVLNGLVSHYEIIFVDDGSTDRSRETIRRFQVLDRSVRYIRFRRNFGKSAAFAAGMKAARYDIIVTMDADLQDIPEQLPRLIEKLEEGFDLVSGWRHKRRDRPTKRFASLIYNRVTSFLTGVRLHDINCGFKCYRREVLEELQIYGERHRYIPVLASYRGFRLGEVRIEHAPRVSGKSRYGFDRILGGIFSLLSVILMTRYTNKPLHFFGMIGVLLFGSGNALLLYLFYERIFSQQWLTNRPGLLIGTIFVIVGVQIISFGLLAEMIAFSYRRDDDYSIVEKTESLDGSIVAVKDIPDKVESGDPHP